MKITGVIIGAIGYIGFLLLTLMFGAVTFGTTDGQTASMAMFACMILATIPIVLGKYLFDQAELFSEKKDLFPCTWLNSAVFSGLCLLFLEGAAIKELDLKDAYDRLLLITGLAAVAGAAYLFGIRSLGMHRRFHRVGKLKKERVVQKNRRYTMLVKEASSGCLYGRISGEIHTGDHVFLLLSDKTVGEATVQKIIKNKKETGKAANAYVTVYVDYDGPVEKYMVLTDIRPSHQENGYNLEENPYLLAIVNHFREENGDYEYKSSLVSAIRNAVYLVPAKKGKTGIHASDLTARIQENMDVQFLRVSSSTADAGTALPVFTDWDAFSRYRTVMEMPESVSLSLTYKQCSDLSRSSYQGMVINPFGPHPFYLANEFFTQVERIEQLSQEREQGE